MNEEIVLILDANHSMREEISARWRCSVEETNDEDREDVIDHETSSSFHGSKNLGLGLRNIPEERRWDAGDFLGTTKFDVARCIAQDLIHEASSSRSLLDNQTDVLALITLRGTPPENLSRTFSTTNKSESRTRKRTRPWSSSRDEKSEEDCKRVEFEPDMDIFGGCRCYTLHPNDSDYRSNEDRIHFLDWCSKLLGGLHASQAGSVSPQQQHRTGVGDFVTGIVRATEVLRTEATVGVGRRKIVLVTDARHKVLEIPKSTTTAASAVDGPGDPMDDLVLALNHLRTMNCTLEVVGIGFRREIVACLLDKTVRKIGRETKDATSHDQSLSDDESNGDVSDDDCEEDDVDEETDVDWSDVQDQNELLLIDLVEKLGGCVLAVNCGEHTDDFYGVRTVLAKLAQRMEPLPSEKIPTAKRRLEDGNDRMSDCNYKFEKVDGNRYAEAYRWDRSSLQPMPETRTLYWNGTDDVILPEWIRVALPSRWSKFTESSGDPSDDDDDNDVGVCSWIQIDDPLVARPTRDAVGETESAGGGNQAGNWLVGCALEDADRVWEQIAVATAYGKLGPTSRISPIRHLLRTHRRRQEQQQRQRQRPPGEPPGARPTPDDASSSPQAIVVCVGVKDSTDRTEIKRVFNALCHDLAIHPGLLVFQSDLFPDPDMYVSPRRHLPRCLYTADEVLAWT